MDPTERSVSPEKSDIDLSSLILGPATPHVPARDDEDDDNGGARQVTIEYFIVILSVLGKKTGLWQNISTYPPRWLCLFFNYCHNKP